MKVIAWFKDGSFTEIEFQVRYPVAEAIDRARKELGDKAQDVEKWEVEEDFV